MKNIWKSCKIFEKYLKILKNIWRIFKIWQNIWFCPKSAKIFEKIFYIFSNIFPTPTNHPIDHRSCLENERWVDDCSCLEMSAELSNAHFLVSARMLCFWKVFYELENYRSNTSKLQKFHKGIWSSRTKVLSIKKCFNFCNQRYINQIIFGWGGVKKVFFVC